MILALGAAPRKLEIPGEQQFTGMGVSYCATCDGAFFKGLRVAVIGGGDTAFEDARYLLDLAAEVYLVHRRDKMCIRDRYCKKEIGYRFCQTQRITLAQEI